MMKRLAVAALVSGCLEYDIPQNLPEYKGSNPPPIGDEIQEDVIVQTSTPVVDVLFTIDNSCSMDDEQAALTLNFPVFMGYFVGSGLDYHVGVVSTDLDDSQHQGRLRSAGGSLYIDEQTLAPTEVFQQMATMGTLGSGNERGLGAVYLALEEHRNTFNAGFYRDDASIHTVVITDEVDQTQATIITRKEFIDWYSSLKREVNERTFSSIVTMSGLDRGEDYLTVTEKVGGISWNIADSNWDEVLDQLGVQATGLKREYFLSRLPVDGTVEVEVHDPRGIVLPFAETLEEPPSDGFVYDRRRNSIVFVNFLPESASRVVIRYTLLASQEADDHATLAR